MHRPGHFYLNLREQTPLLQCLLGPAPLLILHPPNSSLIPLLDTTSMAYRKHLKAPVKSGKSGAMTAHHTSHVKPGPWQSTQKATPTLQLPLTPSICSIQSLLHNPTPITPPATTMSQTAQKAYTKKKKTWGMQVWPERHQTAAALVRGHCAPRDMRTSSFTLDLHDFVGGPLGGGDPVNVEPSGAQVHSHTTGQLDGQLQGLKGQPQVKQCALSPFPSYSAYDHSKGDCLFNQAD